MKIKTIFFCLRGNNHKSKKNEVEDFEKLSSNDKPSRHKGRKNEGYVSTTHAAADGAGSTNVHSNDAGGVAAAVATAAHVSLMSQDGSAHGGESGGGDGGG
ncbi:uncharacterized protein LOC131653966 [Vicia villosa]|uniref:uncharacterized protein LOC131653966 n=1 Tax=Vicia villosa TaxID=3911 RepID=UPI00273CEF41|nr:uncharacterized protein LOC131653966 [Vicia villosa]